MNVSSEESMASKIQQISLKENLEDNFVYIVVKKGYYADIYGVFTSSDEAKKCIKTCSSEKDEMIIYKTGLNQIIQPYYLNITENIV